jgi:hypothetical protein
MVFTILTMIFLLLIKLPLWELLLLIPLKIQPHPVLLLLFPFNLLLFSLILPLVAIPTFLLYSLHTMVEADPVAIPPLRCLRTIHLLDPGSPSPTCPIGPLRFALEPDPHHAPSTHLNRHTIEGPLHHHRQGHGSLAPREEEGDYDSASDGSSHRVSRADTDPQQSCHRACVCRTGWDQAPNPVQLRPLGSSHGGRIPPGASNPRQRHQRPPAQDLLRYSLGDSHLGPLAQALGQDVSTLLPHEPAAAAHLGTGE